MKGRLVEMLVTVISLIADEEVMKEFADMVLDKAESMAKDSANTLDDRIVLPLCDKIRKSFDIPDNDKAPE